VVAGVIQARERLSLRETCRQVARVYAEQAAFLLPVALILFIPLGLLDAVGEHAGELDADELEAGELAGLALAVTLQVATAALGEVFYAGVAMAAVTESMEGRPRASIGQVMRHLPYLTLIAVDVLFALGLAVGFALLVVPGLIFFARYVLTAPVVEIERRGVTASFRRSRVLSRGHAPVLLVLLGGLWILTDALTSALQDGGLSALGESLAAEWAIAVVIGVVITPIWAVAVCVVTWQLIQRERRTGLSAEV
jgi:hypothetical protein